jgi:hypothetical protein
MNKQLADIGEGISGACMTAIAIITPFLRTWRTKWGATEKEYNDPLTGDDIIANPKWQYTQAITINVPAEKVWPWLVQIGQGRGGFYSYQVLENLVGCNIHNADRIIPEFQHLEVGDNVLLHPKVPYPVALVEPGHAIVLHYDTRAGLTPIPGTKAVDYFESTWLFFIDTGNGNSTRMISRFRIDYNLSMWNKISYGYFVEPVSSTMQRKMLLGIKRRAEAGNSTGNRYSEVKQ